MRRTPILQPGAISNHKQTNASPGQTLFLRLDMARLLSLSGAGPAFVPTKPASPLPSPTPRCKVTCARRPAISHPRSRRRCQFHTGDGRSVCLLGLVSAGPGLRRRSPYLLYLAAGGGCVPSLP